MKGNRTKIQTVIKFKQAIGDILMVELPEEDTARNMDKISIAIIRRSLVNMLDNHY